MKRKFFNKSGFFKVKTLFIALFSFAGLNSEILSKKSNYVCDEYSSLTSNTDKLSWLYFHYYSPLVTRILLYEKVPYISSNFRLVTKLIKDDKILEISQFDANVSGNMLIGKKIKINGKINNHDFSLISRAKANLMNLTAVLDTEASIDKQKYLQTKAILNKQKTTTVVSGNICANKIAYTSFQRNSEGLFANVPYHANVEGVYQDPAKENLLKILSKINFNEQLIGSGLATFNSEDRTYSMSEFLGDYKLISEFKFY